MHQVGGGRQNFAGAGKQLRVVSFEPENFWPHRLRGKRIAALVKHHGFTNAAGEFGDLGGSPVINAIENTIHQWLTVAVNWEHAWPDCTGANRPDGGCRHLAVLEQLAADMGEVPPPIFACAMFCPARLRHEHLVRLRRRRDHHTIGINQNTF